MNRESKHAKSILMNLIIVLACLFLYPLNIPGQEASRWIQTNGPEGGIMHAVAIHPNNNDILFSCGVGNAVFKSNDAGENWITQGRINDSHQQILADLIINPANPNTMYLRGGRGIYKSLDAGRTWDSVTAGIETCHLNITSLGIDHANPQVLYAGTYSHCPDEAPGAMYKSHDGGKSWNNITSTLNFPIHTQVIDLACHNSLIYISVQNVEEWGGGKLYISRNGGQSWEEMESVFRPGHFHQSIYIDKENPNIAYLGFASNDITLLEGEHLLKTSDKGKTWQSLLLPGLDANVKVMGKDEERNLLYVGSGAYLFKSQDEGKTWSEITPPWRGSNEATHIAIDSSRNTLFIASPFAGGIVKSDDGGLNWRLVQNGLLNTNVALLTVKNEPGSQTLYAGSSNGGVFVTTDYGDTWSRKRPDDDKKVYVDELLYNIPSHSFYVTNTKGVVFKSQDDGNTWSKLIDPIGTGFRFGSIYAMTTAPSNRDTIYALKNGYGIYKSTSSGGQWEFLRHAEVDYTYSIAVHPDDPNIVFSGHATKPFQDETMIRRSLDGGQTWSTPLTIANASAVTSVVFDPSNPSTLYAGSTGLGGRLWVSHDRGNQWAELNPSLNFTNIHFMTADPNHSHIAYVATWGGGAYRTDDGGRHWDRLENAPTISASSILVDPRDSDILYMADRLTPRIYKSQDRGLTWTVLFDAGPPYYRVLSMSLSSSSVLYVSIFDSKGPMSGDVFRTENGSSHIITGELPRLPVAMTNHPQQPDVLYAVLHGHGVYKSTDKGQAWTLLSGPGSGLPQSPPVGFNNLILNPHNPTIAYLIGGCDVDMNFQSQGADPNEMHTVYRSMDGGQTWLNLNDGHLGSNCGSIKGLSVSPTDPERLFIGTNQGVFQSLDGGLNWKESSGNLPFKSLSGVSLNTDGTILYAPTLGGGIFTGEVSNSDISWTNENTLLTEIQHVQILVDPKNSNILYASSYPGGVFKSIDRGQTWNEANFGLPNFYVQDPSRQGYYALAIDPNNTNILYLGIYGVGVYRSMDGAATWYPIHGTHRTMQGLPITSLLIDPSTQNHLWVAAETGVYETLDGGEHWKKIGNLDVRTMTLGSNSKIFIGTRGYEIWSKNAWSTQWQQYDPFGSFGTSWPQWDRSLSQYSSLLIHPHNSNILYFGTFPAGVYKSINGGLDWKEMNIGWLNDGAFSLVFHPDNPEILYAGTYNGVNRSLDGAATWETCDNGWPDEQWVFSIAFDPYNPDIMYACSKNGEEKGTGREGFHGTVMKSVNAGQKWFPITDGLNLDQEFYNILVDKNDPNTLYLASEMEGVFISRNAGMQWEAWNEGLTNLYAGNNGDNVANVLAQSVDGKWLFWGTNGSCLFKRQVETSQDPNLPTPTPYPISSTPTPTPPQATPTPPVSQATPTPGQIPLPSSHDFNLAYAEDFQDHTAQDWALCRKTTITRMGESNYVLSLLGFDPTKYNGKQWSNFLERFKIFFADEGDLFLWFREGSYFILTNKNVFLYKDGPQTNPPLCSKYGIGIDTRRWYVVDILGMDEKIVLYINGYPIMECENPDLMQPSSIGFESGDDKIHIDDIEIYEIDSPPVSIIEDWGLFDRE